MSQIRFSQKNAAHVLMEPTDRFIGSRLVLTDDSQDLVMKSELEYYFYQFLYNSEDSLSKSEIDPCFVNLCRILTLERDYFVGVKYQK